jgi:glycosyltransferase involved in cell wall biosynthesis
MRIARILTRLNLGGPARQVLASDPVLVARGHQVRVYAGTPEPGEGDLFDELAARGVDVRRVPNLARGVNPAKDLLAQRFLKKELLAYQPDLVHTHASKAGLLGRRAARALKGNAILVHTFHGHVLEGYFPNFVSKRLIAIERALAAECDRIFAVSHATADDLIRLGVVEEGQVGVVWPGVELEALRDLPVARPRPAVTGGPRTLCGLDDQALIIGVVGRLADVKRPELALDAFLTVAVRHPKAHLVFIGDGEGRRALENRITSLAPEWQARVHMVGALSDPVAIFGDLDVLLMSSRTEGLPVALIEASAAGVPAVCTNVGGINEIVAHERTGYLANEDDELAMHLDTILGDDTQRQLQSQRARMRVSERYTGAALASRLETHYLSIREERAAAQ